MTLYHWNSGLTWEQYLQEHSFIRDIDGTIRKTGQAIRYKISDQTKQIVANDEILHRNFKQSFDQTTGTLAEGFGIAGEKIDALKQGIEDLGAAFEWGMGLLAEQLTLQNQLLQDILERLEILHQVLQTPSLTQAQELYNIGRERLRKGLLDKALESFLEAEKRNDVDFLTQYFLGHLYLYGKDEDCNVIDLAKAKQHFRYAARYAKAEIADIPEARKYCGKAYFYASMACYSQASEKNNSGDTVEAKRLTQEAGNLAKQVMDIYPELTEGFYLHAKICALTDEVQSAIQSLEIAIKHDWIYCIKVDLDRDFDSIRPNILELFETLCQQAEKEANETLDEAYQLLNNPNIMRNKPYQEKQQIGTLLSQAKKLYQNKPYFDCLAAIELIKQANDEIKVAYCPRGHGKLKLWRGKPRCWTCGWPDK